MIAIRPAQSRGHTKWSWLDSYHTFSFGRYIDRDHTSFRSLRVINDDIVAPGQGFEEHPHADMEIISYVASGRLAHKDSTGHAHENGPGGVQVMSAGTGVTHSEFNPSDTEPVRLLQIWILPDRKGHTPAYAQRDFPPSQRQDKLALLVSGPGKGAPLTIHQDALVYASLLSTGKSIRHAIADGRAAYLQMVRGSIDLNGHALRAGDGAAVEAQPALTLTARSDAEFLLFDLS